MKTSELIEQLKELMEKHGDLDVNMAACEGNEDNEYECEIISVAIFENKDGDIGRFLICDHETTMSFME